LHPDSCKPRSTQFWPNSGHGTGVDVFSAVPALRQARRQPTARDAAAAKALQEPSHSRRIQNLGRWNR